MSYTLHLYKNITSAVMLIVIIPGPKVIKKCSYSAQLSLKFQKLPSIKISRNSAFSKPRMLFLLLIYVIIGILTFTSRKKFMSAELSTIFFYIYNLEARARGYKTFFMLNSGEHEILNAHKYKNIKKFSLFQTQIS